MWLGWYNGKIEYEKLPSGSVPEWRIKLPQQTLVVNSLLVSVAVVKKTAVVVISNPAE